MQHPRVLGGEPIVQGTRLAVRHVVLTARELGGTAGVLTAYPQLTHADVREALAYYADHTAEIDRYIRENLDEALGRH